jgi:hypothetical protein
MGLGITLFLRKAMDDPARTVCLAGCRAMAALLCTPAHEVLLDGRFETDNGHETVPQRPTKQAGDSADDESEVRPSGLDTVAEEEEDARGDEEHIDGANAGIRKKAAHDIEFNVLEAQADLVEAVLAMDLLPRVRYLMEVGL